jgi:two-component SAPR family response regulator
MNNENNIKIYMLGGFTIAGNGIEASEKDYRASKVWKLIQYLVINRDRAVPHTEIMDLFCSGEQMTNPENALRTMIYRTRALLADSGFDNADDLIISKRGTYYWNTNITSWIDTVEFEELYEKINSSESYTKEDGYNQLELLLKATELYRGDFLPESAGESWVMPLEQKYRSMYINCAHKTLKLLIEDGRYLDAEKLCGKAVRVDAFDEELLEYRLQSLIAQGKNAEAFDEYKRMETMFFDVMGASFSQNLRKLYNQIERPRLNEGISLDELLNDWLKDIDHAGAFYCDLSVFKAVCQIEARSIFRSGKSIYIVSIDTKPETGDKRSGVMKQLAMSIPSSLRQGDLFTRSGPNQYLLMLRSLTYEDCKMLIKRIIRTLDSRRASKIVGTSIQAINPV